MIAYTQIELCFVIHKTWNLIPFKDFSHWDCIAMYGFIIYKQLSQYKHNSEFLLIMGGWCGGSC